MLYHFSKYDITIYNQVTLDKNNHIPDISFACLAAASLHYDVFKKLVEGLPFSDQVFCSIVITHYRWYNKFMEGPYLFTTFKDYKEGGININRKNNEFNTFKKDLKDDKRDIEDFAIDMKSVVDPDVDIINTIEANKSVKDTISVIPNEVEKEVDDTYKGTEEVEKGVADANKGIGDIVSAFLEKVGMGVSDVNKSAKNTISNFLKEVMLVHHLPTCYL